MAGLDRLHPKKLQKVPPSFSKIQIQPPTTSSKGLFRIESAKALPSKIGSLHFSLLSEAIAIYINILIMECYP